MYNIQSKKEKKEKESNFVLNLLLKIYKKACQINRRRLQRDIKFKGTLC